MAGKPRKQGQLDGNCTKMVELEEQPSIMMTLLTGERKTQKTGTARKQGQLDGDGNCTKIV